MDRLSDFFSELLNKRDLMHFYSWTGKSGATLIWTPRVLCYNEGSGHVLMRGMISKNNYESAILWRHARRSYFRRFHWISESFLFHSGGVSSMLLPSGRSILSLDGLHQWSADLSWWVQTWCKPIILSLRTGLFYKAREFAWANFVHMRQPTPPPNVCTIGINCFALFYWIHA